MKDGVFYIASSYPDRCVLLQAYAYNLSLQKPCIYCFYSTPLATVLNLPGSSN